MSAPFSPAEGTRALTVAEVKSELQQLDLTRQGTIGRYAEMLARDRPGDGRDLLHDAVFKALTSRKCKADITVEQFLGGVMRSIASTARRSRDRQAINPVYIPTEVVAEALGIGGYSVRSAEEILEAERVRDLCTDLLEQLSRESPLQAALIDAVGHGLRGDALANAIGVSTTELATARRALKRHVQRLWPTIEQRIEQTEKG